MTTPGHKQRTVTKVSRKYFNINQITSLLNLQYSLWFNDFVIGFRIVVLKQFLDPVPIFQQFLFKSLDGKNVYFQFYNTEIGFYRQKTILYRCKIFYNTWSYFMITVRFDKNLKVIGIE